jgi:uncharacterized protein (DUF58 family)
LRAALRQQLAVQAGAWALRRQGRDRLPLTLDSRRIYILPTRAGWGLAALLLVLLVAGLNYNNNLALLLTFLLAGVQGVALVLCHRQLLGLRIDQVTLTPAHVGHSVSISLTMHPEPSVDAADLHGFIRHAGTRTASAAASGHPDARLILSVPAWVRGRWQLPTLGLETHAPFGLFRAWVWLHLDAATVVYPAAVGALPLAGSAGEDDGVAADRSGQDEWRQLRPWREGDPLRQVAWKTYARGGPLQVAEYSAQAGGPLLLDLARVPLPNLEQRLSQLCRWALTAQQQGRRFGLRLPQVTLPPDQGAAHLHRCLSALALHGTASPGGAR